MNNQNGNHNQNFFNRGNEGNDIKPKKRGRPPKVINIGYPDNPTISKPIVKSRYNISQNDSNINDSIDNCEHGKFRLSETSLDDLIKLKSRGFEITDEIINKLVNKGDQITGQITNKLVNKKNNGTTNNITDKLVNKGGNQIADKITDKSLNSRGDQITDKITDKLVNNKNDEHNNKIIYKTVLSRNGYRINKKIIDNELIEEYKKELTVKPMCTDEPDIKPYPLFRETPSELIVPRYYGISKLGNPEKDILKCIDANINFKGQLRDLQIDIVNKAINHMKEYGGGIISVPCGHGKCLAKGTKIIMYDGSIKAVENIKVGEVLMGDDSTPREVLSLARGSEQMFDIISTEGVKYTVNRSHILSLKYDSTESIKINGIVYNKGDIIDISVDEYLKLSKMYNGGGIPLRGYRAPINFPKRNVPIDPYIIGHWLGEYNRTIKYSNIDHDIIKYFRGYANSLKFEGGRIDSDILCDQFKNLNIFKNEGIPNIYKYNSKDIRLEVLAGILDSDGTLKGDKGGYDLYLNNKKLMNDIIYLSRSVGLVCYKSDNCSKGTYYKFSIYGNGVGGIPIKILEKGANPTKQIKDPLVYGITVKSVGIGDYYGFEIDGNKRFLLGDFTVTHNTVMALKLACELKAKTLVIVHKTFLQDQWIERAKQFTDARLGIIRQNKEQVKNNDIVIGMMQSISIKDYDPMIFSDFKLVIFDECLSCKEKIITNSGNLSIGKLYDLWKNSKQLPLIKSFNEKIGQFEFKKLTYAWEKRSRDLVRIEIGKGSKITCTPNHKFLTINGYKEAGKLTSNDILLGSYDENAKGNIFAKKLNSDQEQIILGSFLGNGHICILPNKRYKLVGGHYINEDEYYQWKASMFGIKTKPIEKDSYVSKLVSPLCTDIFDSEFDFPDIKGTCPQWLIDKIDFRGIAIWIMDSAFINKTSLYLTISTYSFDEDTQKRLVKRLTDLGISCNYYSEGGYYYININEEGTKLIISRVYLYLHESMEHKVLIYNNFAGKYIWDNNYENYGTCRVTSIENIKKKNIYVYDIEVEDNHNFIVSLSKGNSYGTIAHNCHHTPARIFSNSLYKAGARYTLGLSATPHRFDGLTRVIHWYLGDFIHQEKNTKNKQVIAKIFHYKSNNPLFREKKRWPKFKPDVVKMINNICELEQRTKHIVDIINQLRKFPERKILILSGRKSHLLDMKGSIDKSIEEDIINEIILAEECRTYLYTGDSTKQERKDAETFGDILFATYDLAHEGLDIERLNTIILATSKKNIIQAVGRIMRKILKSGDVRPLIIDIADELSVFKYQSECRIAQYSKSKYKIEHYYLKNDKIITFDTYMQQEQNLTQEEIELLPERQVYDPKLSTILNMQRVEHLDDDIGIICDDNDDRSNDTIDNGDDEGEDDEDNENNKHGKIIVKGKKKGPQIRNTLYMF